MCCVGFLFCCKVCVLGVMGVSVGVCSVDVYTWCDVLFLLLCDCYDCGVLLLGCEVWGLFRLFFVWVLFACCLRAWF